MLWVGAVALGIAAALLAYVWLFARFPPARRLAYAIGLAVAIPLVVFVLLVALVAFSFYIGG
jgi:hypothetical protein